MLQGWYSTQSILVDESSDSKQEENADKKTKPDADQKPNIERDSSRTLSSKISSSSSSALESNDEKEGKEPSVSPKRESSASTGSTSEAGTAKVDVEQEARVTKKRRTDKDGTAVVTATTLTVRQEDTRTLSTGRIKGNVKPRRQVNERFRRVDPTKHEPIADNRYVAKV